MWDDKRYQYQLSTEYRINIYGYYLKIHNFCTDKIYLLVVVFSSIFFFERRLKVIRQ
jgi:hypothetical protein